MGAFNDLAAQFDQANPRRKGDQFEAVCKWYLENDPVYQPLLRRVWLWDDWPGRRGIDAGIDLVAEDHDGKLWAIQAKAYDPAYSISKRDVDKFVAESSRTTFTHRLLIGATDKRHHLATRLMDDLGIPFLGLTRLREADNYLDWPDNPDALRPAKPLKPKKPTGEWSYQNTAMKDVVKGFKCADRGQLIMACGTGKTLTAWFIKEKLAAERTLVLVPSLSLLKQTMWEWQTADPRKPFASLPVCSDESVGSLGEDAAVSHTSDLGVPVTTDPQVIAEFLRKRSGTRVVFSTYQSSPQIAAAFALGRVPEFDLVIADEAHRVAGPVSDSSGFGTVLDPAAIKAKRRLFMTATPRYFTGRIMRAAKDADYEVASMDDHTKFGEVFHRLSFGEAIDRKLLTDYRVAIIGVDDSTYRDWAERGTLVTFDGQKLTDARSLAGQIGLAKAMRKFDLRRVISFHSRVKAAKDFATSMKPVLDWMPARQRPKGRLWSKHASGEMSAGDRDVLIQHLKRLDDGERGLLANARCLTEGVDVPALDGVAFIDPRRSEVDIVQAVGRAIRKSDIKEVGTIVIPVFIDTDEDPEVALDSSVFKPVWNVIKALRAHDTELGEQLDSLRREMGRKGRKPSLPSKIYVDVPATVGKDFINAFDVHLVEATTAPWEFWFGLLEKYTAQHGTALVPGEYSVGDYRLGRWVIKQRSKQGSGDLADERTKLLAKLPGWSWDTYESRWEEGFTQLTRYAGVHRSTDIPARFLFDGYRLGQWVTVQRQGYNRGDLDADRVARLESVPGWVWNPLGDRWETGYAHLKRYVKEYGTARPGQDYVIDGYKLGSWAASQRSRYGEGKLEKERQQRLEALPGWVWDMRSAQWEAGFEVLRRYVNQYGTAQLLRNLVFEGYRLGQWVSVMRHSKKNGTLELDRQRRLEELPGWTWNKISSQWDKSYEKLRVHVAEHGNALVPSEYVVDGFKLGRWVVTLRVRKSKGRLDEEKARKLEELPGWTWDTAELKWQEGLRRLIEYASEHGNARVIPKYVTPDGYKLGLWAANLRARRSGLDPAKVRQLQAVPGWTWDRNAERWEDGFRHLTEYVEQHGDARPVREVVCDDGFKLGQWVTVQRTTKAKREMDEERIRRLEELPNWTWDPRADAWEQGFNHLVEFLRDSNGNGLTQQVVCRDGYKLGVWITSQRVNYEKGNLSSERQRRLESLPGWIWQSNRKTSTAPPEIPNALAADQ